MLCAVASKLPIKLDTLLDSWITFPDAGKMSVVCQRLSKNCWAKFAKKRANKARLDATLSRLTTISLRDDNGAGAPGNVVPGSAPEPHVLGWGFSCRFASTTTPSLRRPKPNRRNLFELWVLSASFRAGSSTALRQAYAPGGEAIHPQ
jgi:hypothetical protein